MNIKDRTSEFRSIVHSENNRLFSLLVNDQADPTRVYQNEAKISDLQTSSFQKSINHLAGSISNCLIKVETFHDLCKSRSMFDDRTTEIQSLLGVIKEDITFLKEKLHIISEALKTNQVTCVGKQDKNHKMMMILYLDNQLVKISKQFKIALETRSQNLKTMQKRKQILSNDNFVSSLDQSAEPLRYQEDNSSPLNFSQAGYMSPQQEQQLVLADQSRAYLNDRAAAMYNIESTIVELGDIFKQLAHYVQEQEEQIHLIDLNIQNAEMRVEAAHVELLKYLRSISSNRWLMFKIFAVLFIFMILFAIIK